MLARHLISKKLLGIKRAICQYCEANNKCMQDYDETIENT